MNKLKMFIAKRFFPELLKYESDASGNSGGGTGRELASEFVKRVSYKEDNSTDFEDPEYSLADIQTAYNTDSYVRQGVDKYVDQIFKEGYQIYGNDSNVVDYINLRLAFIAEATGNPTSQFLTDIAEDLVKYGNCMIVKSRTNDPNAFPQGQTLTGLYGKDPIGGYFCANPVTMKCKRDDYGVIQSWQQDNDKGKQEFNPEDVVHFYYKREKGKAYGSSFLIPVLDDVQALRQAEENVLKMMYRNIYPFYHVMVGTEEATGTSKEVDAMKEAIDDMDVEGGLVTTERVNIKPIAADKVIDASPYLKYMESRVFTGFGIPEILWGRGSTSNKATGDDMTAEMGDRIRALHKTFEAFFNAFIIKELLMEGGYDPVLNPDQNVEFKFNDNDVDIEIKKQVHAIYKYEHNAITEDEMRLEIGMEPIPDGDREKLFVELITRETIRLEAQLNQQVSTSSESGTKETNNKSKNGGGRPKTKNELAPMSIGLLKDAIDSMEDGIDKYIKQCLDSKGEILQVEVFKKIVDCGKEMLYIINMDNNIDGESCKNMIAISITRLTNAINSELIGWSPYANNNSSIIDMIDMHMGIFKDNALSMITNMTNSEAAL